MAESLEIEDFEHGARTIPSKPIKPVDRNDRIGEDRALVDRLEAEKASFDAPDNLKEIIESETISSREKGRADWKSAKSDVSNLLDDDLDL